MGDEKYSVVLDLHATMRGIQEILTYSEKSESECYDNLYLAVYQAFSRTGDQEGLDKLDDDLDTLKSRATGTWDQICKDILIPRATLALLRKFRRVDVLKLLHDSSYHDPSPPRATPSTPPLPEQTSDEDVVPLLVDQTPVDSDYHDCIVCGERPREIIFGKCGHCCVCEICYKELLNRGMSCPMCRQQLRYRDKRLTLEQLNHLIDQTKLDNDVYIPQAPTDTSPRQKIHLSSRLRGTLVAPSQSNLHELLRQLRGGA